jgi:hypothetical protein
MQVCVGCIPPSPNTRAVISCRVKSSSVKLFISPLCVLWRGLFIEFHALTKSLCSDVETTVLVI